MSRLLTIAVSFAALLAVVQPQAALGQSSALQRQLAAAERLDCSFPALATGTWDGDTSNAEVSEAALEIAFFDVNADEGTAEAEGLFGASFISARYSQGYLHLMQVSDSGPLHVTTVLAQEASEGRFKAVHVRLEYTAVILPGFTSRPEMYVGTCGVDG